MGQGSRPERIGEEIRQEISLALLRVVQDPGIGLVTLTRVKVSPDLQVARVYYTTLGDAQARRASARALERAGPFLRRQIGRRLRLKRVPHLEFFFDEATERSDRIHRILQDLNAERAAAASEEPGAQETASGGADHDPAADRAQDPDE